MTILIVCLAAGTIFFIWPQLWKLWQTLGIHDKIVSGKDVPFWTKFHLMTLGMKTPVISALTICWTFVSTESDQLLGFDWSDVLTKEHAAMVTTGLWLLTLWAHFSGLNTAAAIVPVPGQEHPRWK
jgi:hypothetical protein